MTTLLKPSQVRVTFGGMQAALSGEMYEHIADMECPDVGNALYACTYFTFKDGVQIEFHFDPHRMTLIEAILITPYVNLHLDIREMSVENYDAQEYDRQRERDAREDAFRLSGDAETVYENESGILNDGDRA